MSGPMMTMIQAQEYMYNSPGISYGRREILQDLGLTNCKLANTIGLKRTIKVQVALAETTNLFSFG